MVDRSASAQPTADTASQEFTGEVFLVTGAAQGLGLEIATTGAARGAHVALCDLDGDKVRDAAAEIERVHKVETIGHPCDVSDAASITSVVENVITTFGRLDHLVNNAGTLHIGAIAETPPGSVSPGARRQRHRCVSGNARRTARHGGRAPRQHRQLGIARRQEGNGQLRGLLRFEGGSDLADPDRSARSGAISSGQRGVPRSDQHRYAAARVRDCLRNDRPGPERNSGQLVEGHADAVCFLASQRARQITDEAINVNGGLLMD